VTSFCASAARAGISIGENMESIAIIPSVYDLDRLDGAFDRFDNIVLMKVSGNLNEVLDRLKEKGLEGNAVVVSKCGFEDEKVYFGAQETGGEKLSYFTTMIIKKDRKES
jgi:precorrin-2/cobalt-factor-2 C20-methyltransferase